MTKICGYNKNRGVTLIEVVIALGLFAILIVPLMQNFVTSARVNAKGRKEMIATDVAQTIMEGFAGKTYEDIIAGLDRAEEGFVFEAVSSNNARYAFSSINDDFYNKGGTHVVQADWPKDLVISGGATEEILPYQIELSAVVKTKYGLSKTVWPTVSDTETSILTDDSVPLDKILATSAVKLLQSNINTPVAGTSLLGPHEDETPLDLNNDGVPDTDANTGEVLYPVSCDKRLYFSYSADGSNEANGTARTFLPRMACMLYTRVQKEKYFFDVMCVFTPMVQKPDSGTVGKYYTYDVKVSVYEYEYESTDDGSGNTSVSCKKRFDDSDPTFVTLEGEPIVTLESGIMNTNYNKN